MSNYNSNLQSKNAALQTILNIINELPEASGGGGTNVETSAVTIESSVINMGSILISWSTIENNSIVSAAGTLSNKTIYPIRHTRIIIDSIRNLSVSIEGEDIYEEYRLNNDEFAFVGIYEVNGDGKLIINDGEQ